GPRQFVKNLGVVINPCTRGDKQQSKYSRQEFPRTSETQHRVPPTMLPAGLPPAWPEHNRRDIQQSTEKQPVQREPIPGCTIWRVPEKVRINHLGPPRKLQKMGRDVQRPPDGEIKNDESDVQKIANIFVGR